MSRYTVCVISDRGPDDQSIVFAGPEVTYRQYEHIPAGLLHRPAGLFDRVSKQFGEQFGTLVLPRVPFDLDDPDGSPVSDEEVRLAASIAGMLADASNHGWHVGGQVLAAVEQTEAADPLSGWFHFRHDAGHRLNVAILPMLDQGKTPLFNIATDTGYRIARQLVDYARHVGAPWYATAGVSGCAAVRAKWQRAAETPMSRARARNGEHVQPLWHVPMPDHVPLAHGDIVWKAKPVDGTLDAGVPAHTFDMHTMYLAAMQAAALPYGELMHVTIEPGSEKAEQRFTGKHAGVWRVAVEDIDPIFCTGEILPPLISLRMMEDDGTLWLTTPLLAELANRRAFGPAGFKICEYYYTSETRQWLKPISEDWRDALYRAHPPIPHHPDCGDDCVPSCMRFALQATYKQTVGMIAKEGGSIHNPLARAMVVDTARRNMWVKLWDFYMLTGLAPTSVKTDEVVYRSEKSALWIASRIGVEDKPGKFRHVHTKSNGEVLV